MNKNKKILSIIHTAYRAHLEEQDDTSLWFNQALRIAYLQMELQNPNKSAACIDILLTGNAINYAVNSQEPTTVKIGKMEIGGSTCLQRDLTNIINSKGQIFYLLEDALLLGIDASMIIPGIKEIKEKNMANLFTQYDQIWRW